MQQRSNNLDTVHVALELMRRIPRNHKVTALELQQQLADAGIVRDLRSVQRQLEALSARYDIERDDKNKPYGYRWKPNSKGFALPILSAQESVMLSLAEQHLSQLLPASMMRSMQTFFNQARTNLAPYASSASAEREWLKKVRVVNTNQPLLPPKIATGVFETVSDALFANHWLEVDYRNVKGERKLKKIMPLGLAQQGPRVFLVCRFEGFENERTLALHRIFSAKDTRLPFDKPADFDLERFDDEGRFGFGEGKVIALHFWIRKSVALHLLEAPLSKDQMHSDVGDGYEIRTNVVESDQLRWWLRSYGKNIRVIEPAELLNSGTTMRSSRLED